MTLNELLLQKLSNWRPASPGRHSLAAVDEASGWTVHLTADRCDELGCLTWELIVRRASVPADAPALQAWAEAAAVRVTGLLEPLKVVEVDEARREALLRSNEPTRRGDDRFYYELLLKGQHEAQLRRYQAAPSIGGHRQQVAFALTHEALAKVVADLLAV